MQNTVTLRDILFQACVLVGLSALAFGYELTIVHTNDVHAHFGQTNVYSGDCSEKQAKEGECYGGEARRVTVINEARANIPNTLVLDAGDRFVDSMYPSTLHRSFWRRCFQFCGTFAAFDLKWLLKPCPPMKPTEGGSKEYHQSMFNAEIGTLWFTTYKGMAAAHFVNKENFDAMCLGNHEFDYGVDGLLPFIDNLTIPVVGANIDVSREPHLQGKIKNSLVLERGGEKIGIVGYTTTDTSFSSSPGPSVSFTNEIEAIRLEVEKLKAEGIKIIVGLSHSGYMMDKKLAAEVEGMDVIVGGHSHTFLYTGDEPSTEEKEGPYPTKVVGPTGKNVLIVQAYAWGKYMGMLNVIFDDNMDVVDWSGNPILLNNSVPRDNDTLADIVEMAKPLEATRTTVVGSTAVRLEGERWMCRTKECNSGNIITDAMVWYHIDNKQYNDSWALAAIALQNGGGIRATTEQGPVSMGQVLTVLPFGNTIELVTMKGKHLKEVMEHSVANYDTSDPSGRFLQVSGLRVQYDLSKDPGSRVHSLEARCLRCQVPIYSPVEDEELYNVLSISFILGGGDKYDMIKKNMVDKVDLNSPEADVFAEYLKAHPLAFPEAEGRIKFVNNTVDYTKGHPIIVHRCPDTGVNAAIYTNRSLSFVFLCVLFAYCFTYKLIS